MQKANCGSVGWNGAETGRLEPSLFPAPGVCIRFQTKGSQWVRAAQESRNGKAGPPVPVSSELKRSFLNRELIRFKYVACVDLRRRHSRGRLCHRAGPAPIPPNEWSGDCQHRQHQAEECREYSRRQVEDVAGVEFAIPEAGVLYWGGHLSRALHLEYFARVGVDRSEERRVGEEGRSRWVGQHLI